MNINALKQEYYDDTDEIRVTEIEEKSIAPPLKGKKASQKEMAAKVNDGIKDWGEKYRDRALWFVTL